MVLSTLDRAPGAVHHDHRQGIPAAANQPWGLDGAGDRALRCLCGDGRSVAVPHVDLDQCPTVLCGAFGGFARASHFRRVCEDLAREHRHARPVEYHGARACDVRGDDLAGCARELVRGPAHQSGGRAVALSRHGVVPAAVRAEHRHRFGVYLCLCALSDPDLRNALDHRAGDDHPLSRLQLAHHDFRADAGAR